MIELSSFIRGNKKSNRKTKRVGRGIGSGKGKTCGRGMKGAKARSGYKRRHGAEGGQLPLYRKIPIKGFSNGMFKSDVFAINVGVLDKLFNNNEIVNVATLREKHLISNKSKCTIKILGNGELSKSLCLEVNAISESAKRKVENSKGSINLIK